MTICARDHERIAYKGFECPVCCLLEEVAELKSMVDHLSMELEAVELPSIQAKH